MAVTGINAGPGLTTTHDAHVTPAMQGLTGIGQPAASAPASGIAIGGGSALSTAQALRGNATIGGHSDRGFTIEPGGLYGAGGGMGAVLGGGGGASVGGGPLLGSASIGGHSDMGVTIELGGQPVTGGGVGALLGGGGGVSGSGGTPSPLGAVLGGATLGGTSTSNFDLVPGAPAAGGSMLAPTASTGAPIAGGGAVDPARALRGLGVGAPAGGGQAPAGAAPPSGATGPIVADSPGTIADAAADRALAGAPVRTASSRPKPERATTAPASISRPGASAPAPAPAAIGTTSPAPAPRTEPVRASQPASRRTKSYTVVRGDTLTSIAKKFSTTVATLVKLNDIANPDRINAGRTIKVPA